MTAESRRVTPPEPPPSLKGRTLALSYGNYGGFYLMRHQGWSRICLGWIAITSIPWDIDDLLEGVVALPETTHNTNQEPA